MMAATVLATAEPVVVEIEKGEKWWGVTDGWDLKQPFSEPFEVNTAQGGASYAPVLISSAGRYIYGSQPFGVAFDGEKITIDPLSGEVEVSQSGKSLREAYILCALKNFPPDKNVPSADLFALPLYKTEYELGPMQGEKEILGYARRLLSEGFPAGIIVVCDGWQSVNGPYGFDADLYPDPKRLVDSLHLMGFKAMLTVAPYVPQWGKVYGEAKKDGQLAKVRFGSERTGTAVLDMSNDKQLERMRAGLQEIEKYGFDGLVFDCVDAGLSEGVFAANMATLAGGDTFTIVRNGSRRPYASFVASTQPGNMSQDMYATLVENVITAGMMGRPYMETDVYVPLVVSTQRSMADYLLLQSTMPVVSVDFAPWRINDQTLYNSVRDALNFRASLSDYVRQLVDESAKTGEPLVRHMEYQFPRAGFADCDDQFMLGSKYLFAPCVDVSGKRMVRLPKGTWIDRAGVKVKGPVVREVDCSAGQLNWFEFSR